LKVVENKNQKKSSDSDFKVSIGNSPKNILKIFLHPAKTNILDFFFLPVQALKLSNTKRTPFWIENMLNGAKSYI